MENNEQLTQNPAIEEGIENETTTSKALKKAIDGNEKKKIVKLIQPSILPAKVRIEVNTLVGGIIAEPAPVADEVMPEMVDNPDTDEEELVEDNADLDGLNKICAAYVGDGSSQHSHSAPWDPCSADSDGTCFWSP